MALTNSEKAGLVGDMLEWQISAAIGARDSMRPGSPSWRYGENIVRHLTAYMNTLLRLGGTVYDEGFLMPEVEAETNAFFEKNS